MQLKIKLLNEKCMPYKKIKSDSGFDLRARIEKPIIIPPKSSTGIIPSGIMIELPEGYEGQVRPRSGLGCKHDVVSLFGTIDNEYRGEVGIKLFNLSDKEFTINPYDRVCQFVIKKVEDVQIVVVNEISPGSRCENGFGSTGVK